jgi:DnaJ-class molecular chaperone
MNAKDQGDLYVYIHVNMPKQLSENQKKLVKQLADAGM